jgi:hypothetical protein
MPLRHLQAGTIARNQDFLHSVLHLPYRRGLTRLSLVHTAPMRLLYTVHTLFLSLTTACGPF